MSSHTATTPAVFLSYAREDSEAARSIADALRAFGVEVWFEPLRSDREARVSGGDALIPVEWRQRQPRRAGPAAGGLSSVWSAVGLAKAEASGEGWVPACRNWFLTLGSVWVHRRLVCRIEIQF